MTEFSKRVEQVSISGIREVFEAAGEDAINLGLGQPDFPTPEHARSAAVEAIQAGDIDLVASRDRGVLEACVEETVTYFSTRESTEAALEAINAADQPLAVQAISERPKTTRDWGEE